MLSTGSLKYFQVISLPGALLSRFMSSIKFPFQGSRHFCFKWIMMKCCILSTPTWFSSGCDEVGSEQWEWCRRYSALIISLINTEFQGFVAGLEPPGLVWGYRVPGAPCSLLLLNDVLLDETWLINITTRLHRINSSYRASSKMAFIGLLNTRTFRQISDF